MAEVTVERVLEIIRQVYNLRQPRTTSYRNINMRIMAEMDIIRGERNWNVRDQDALDLEDDDRINLLRENEEEIMIYVVHYATLDTIFEFLKENGENAELKDYKKLIRKEYLSNLRREGYTIISYAMGWLSGYSELEVVVGFGLVRFCLTFHRNWEFIIEFRPNRNGCQSRHFIVNHLNRIRSNVVDDQYIGLNYNDMAANEFVEIIKYSMEYRNDDPPIVLKNLTFDIETRRKAADPSNRYPNKMFFRKIRRWMEYQTPRNELPKRPRLRPVYTESFCIKYYRHQPIENQPFDLKFLRPEVLTHITVRTWDDRHLVRNRRRQIPEFLRIWDQMQHWRYITELDINDEFLKKFRPNIRKMNDVRMYKLSVRDIANYRREFIRNPLHSTGDLCITSKIRIRHGMCHLKLFVNSRFMRCSLENEIDGNLLHVFIKLRPPFPISWFLIY